MNVQVYALGSMACYGLSTATLSIGRDLPWATLIINVLGALVIASSAP